MRRRDFMAMLAAAGIGSAASTRPVRALSSTASGQIPELVFDSSSTLLDASYGPLTDSGVVSVTLGDTGANTDADGNGDAYVYGDPTPVPMVATDGNVVGMGCRLVPNDTNWQRGNEEFLLNVWDEHVGGGTVLYDEGHGQYYTLADISEFESYAENNGYTVQATTSLASDLSGADGVMIHSPADSFTNSELQALSDFVADGGAVFLHSQSDYSDYDRTGNLNGIAGDLGVAFRFNDDQAVDEVVNAGSNYQPVTDSFNTDFPYFSDREGLGLDPEKTYTVPVEEVLDGDTVKVTFDDGTTESIRVLGLDTPEKAANSQYERIQEWEGIESNTYLEGYADDATTFGKNELSGKTIDLSFDPEEGVRDPFGRLLGYIDYDATGDGNRDTFYNYELVARGYARIYDSGFSEHERFWQAEADARASGTRVWTDSDPDDTSEIRDRTVDDLFFPKTASVRTDSGAIADSRVPVYAESSATQDLDGGYSYSGEIPLVGVDETNRVAVVGGPFLDEGYEKAEGFAVDTSDFENYVFAANLADYLSDQSGEVLVDGGHGQFNASYGLAAEDVAWFMRYLEGQDVGLEGINALTASNLSRGRALIVTTPEEAFTQSEVDAISSFIADGGAVVLLGCGKVTDDARANLNDLAAGLGTDLRVNEDQVVDDTNNVNSDGAIPATTALDTSFPLFSAYTDGTDTSVAVSTGSAASVTASSATLSGSLDDLGGAASADCYFEYREVGASSWNSTAVQTLSATGSYSESISGLAENTDYEFRAVASASDGDADTATAATFTTSDDPAAVSTGSASDVTDASATLSGSLDDLGGAASADCYFEYRQTGAASWTATATQSLSSTGSYSDSVSGLTAGTEYEFRAVADASDGDSATGTAVTFTTSGDASVAVSTGSASGVTASDATLNGSLDDLGGASSADCYFEYRQVGASTWSATATQTLSATGSFSDSVSGLSENTDYEFRAVASASDGDADTATAATFTTSDDPVAVSTGSASDVTDASATLSGSLDDLGGASSADCYFEYRQSGASSWNRTAAQTLSAAGSYSDSVSGLSAGTDYEFRAVASASDGDADTATAATFTTGSATGDAGEISVARVHADASGGDDNDNLTDEYVVFDNVGTATLDLTGWAVEDAVGKRYEFPDGFALDPGQQVTLRTGSGTDTSTDLYWGYGSAVWNNSGDTVYVFDDAGTQVLSRSYSGDSLVSVAVSTGDATDVGSSSATLNGSLDDLGGATSADVSFEYRKVGDSTWMTTATRTLSATGAFSDTVSSLTTGADYEFRAVASASDGDVDGDAPAAFTTGSDAGAAVSTGSASDVTDAGATLSGSLDDLGGAASADCYFEYRETGTSSWTATPVQTLSATGSFSDAVSGLAENTEYEFRAVADASDGDADTGSAVAFTTGDDPVAVSTGSASGVDASSATLNGSLDDLGGASSADVAFEYRQVGASSWNSTAARTLSAAGSFSDTVSGLSEATDYEFRATATASDGDADAGTAATFTTADAAVAVSTGNPTNVSSTSATLNGSLDDLGGAASADCYFEYRQVGASAWNATATQTLSATGAFSEDLTGLSAGTNYEYRAVADASDGDADTGNTAGVTTESGSGDLAVAKIHEDAAGSEYDNLNDEYVVFENVGSAALDLTGWAVEDEAGKRYEFPGGFTLDAGAQVTLHTGSGTDTSTDLYWGYGSPVWNNSGDTVYVFDDDGATVISKTYS